MSQTSGGLYERPLGQAGETAVEEMGLYRHSRRGLTP